MLAKREITRPYEAIHPLSNTAKGNVGHHVRANDATTRAPQNTEKARRFNASARSRTYFFFFLKDPPTPETSPLPLPAALPIYQVAADHRPRREPPHHLMPGRHRAERFRQHPEQRRERGGLHPRRHVRRDRRGRAVVHVRRGARSEEHTSELQSQSNLVCRLLLE